MRRTEKFEEALDALHASLETIARRGTEVFGPERAAEVLTQLSTMEQRAFFRFEEAGLEFPQDFETVFAFCTAVRSFARDFARALGGVGEALEPDELAGLSFMLAANAVGRTLTRATK